MIAAIDRLHPEGRDLQQSGLDVVLAKEGTGDGGEGLSQFQRNLVHASGCVRPWIPLGRTRPGQLAAVREVSAHIGPADT